MRIVSANATHKTLKNCFVKTCKCSDKDILLFSEYSLPQLNLNGIFIITNTHVIRYNPVNCGLQYHINCNRSSIYDIVEDRIIYDGLHLLLYYNLTVVKDFTQKSIIDELTLINKYIDEHHLRFTVTNMFSNGLPYVAVNK